MALKAVDPRKTKAYEDAGYNGAYAPGTTPPAVQAASQPAPTPAPAPKPAPAAAKPLPSVVPGMPTSAGVTEAARAQVMQNLGAGGDLASKLYAPGSFGRVETPRLAETGELLKAQTAALSGMSPQEQEAARTNAILKINDQANTRLRDISNRAAGNGLRGGVVAGENAQVAGAAQGAYASALQELMGKVQKSQVDASTALGNTLSSARGLEQGAQTTNLEAAAGELAGRLSTPFDYSNIIDAANTNDRVEKNAETGRIEKVTEVTSDQKELEKSTQDQLDEIADDKLKTGREGVDNAPGNVFARANGVSTYDDLPAETKQQLANEAGVPVEDLQRYLNDPANKNWLNQQIALAKARRDRT
jgi:hypothetical protein